MSSRDHAADARRILELGNSAMPGQWDAGWSTDMANEYVYVVGPKQAEGGRPVLFSAGASQSGTKDDATFIAECRALAPSVAGAFLGMHTAATEYRAAVDEFIVADLRVEQLRCGCRMCCLNAMFGGPEPKQGEWEHPDWTVLHCEEHAPEGSTRHKAFVDRDAARERLAKAEKTLDAAIGKNPEEPAQP